MKGLKEAQEQSEALAEESMTLFAALQEAVERLEAQMIANCTKDNRIITLEKAIQCARLALTADKPIDVMNYLDVTLTSDKQCENAKKDEF